MTASERLVRRFVALTALSWLPTGLTLPVFVILMQDRGLSLGQVGAVAATASVVVMLCELPTGGLADAVGRRPVLLAAAGFNLVALVVTAVAGGPAAFLAAAAVRGVARALESGPLESWFVDSALALDADADIERGLGRAGTATGLSLAAGSLAAAGLSRGPASPGSTRWSCRTWLRSWRRSCTSSPSIACWTNPAAPGPDASPPGWWALPRWCAPPCSSWPPPRRCWPSSRSRCCGGPGSPASRC